MNARQRIVLVVGAVVLALMTLFPPWVFVFQSPQGRSERFAGYHPIWQGNTPTDRAALTQMFGLGVSAGPRFFSIKIDTTRLAVQMIALLVVTALITAALKSRLATETSPP